MGLRVATLHDVARAADVSTATVSRVLNTPERVIETTRLRVQAAVEALDYRPNRVASLLRSGRTGSIGLLVPDLENPYFAGIAKGAQARAHAFGLTTLLVDSDESPERETELFDMLQQQTDGIVLCSPRAIDHDFTVTGDAPVVLINANHAGVSSINIDYIAVMVKVVEHLRALGHRRMAYIGGPQSSWTDQMRHEGISQAHETYEDVDIVDLGSFAPRVSGGVAAADLAAASGATAVIAYNDLVAIGLLNQLTRRGVRVPQQISIVGCDDTFVAEFASIPLTTVHVDLASMGAKAVDILTHQMPGSPQPRAAASQPPISNELIVRASTGPALPARQHPGPRIDTNGAHW